MVTTRRKPSRTRRRARTRRPSESSSPGGRDAERLLRLEARAELGLGMRGEADLLALEDEGDRAVRLLEVGDHRLPALEEPSRRLVARARGAGRGRPRGSAGASRRTCGGGGARPPRVELLGERRLRGRLPRLARRPAGSGARSRAVRARPWPRRATMWAAIPIVRWSESVSTSPLRGASRAGGTACRPPAGRGRRSASP